MKTNNATHWPEMDGGGKGEMSVTPHQKKGSKKVNFKKFCQN